MADMSSSPNCAGMIELLGQSLEADVKPEFGGDLALVAFDGRSLLASSSQVVDISVD